jgi:hypothetical protein
VVAAPASLIDQFLPIYDFHERHDISVAASAGLVRRATEEWQPSQSLPWRLLLLLRGLGQPRGTLRQWAESMGFLCLAETEWEVVYGQIGRFWSLRERSALRSPRTVEEFRAFDEPDCAVAVMNVAGAEVAPGRSLLSTETRIRALSPSAKRKFRLYWLMIRPFSGLLRRSMLRGIRANALAAQPRAAAL